MVISVVALIGFLIGIVLYVLPWGAPANTRVHTIGLVILAVSFFFLMAGVVGGSSLAINAR